MAVSEVLRFISVLASAIHTGSQFSLSYVSGAALLAAPAGADEATVLAQFRVIFRRGFVLCPPFALVATLANLASAFVSWQQSGTGAALRFVFAALCTASLIPFTLLFIVRGEGLLLEKAAGKSSEEEKKVAASSATRTRDLITEWARLNYMRTLFPLVGALVAYTAH